MPTAAQTRRIIIDMARRRQRPGSGSHPDFLRRRTTDLRFPDMSDTLRGIPWATTGAAAVRMYMPERMTKDLDILIRATDGLEARRRLAELGAEQIGELSIGGSSWSLPDGFPLDMIEGDERWVTAALNAAHNNRDGQGLPVLPIEYQILMKFRAGRPQDVADMSRMLGQASDDQLEATRELFEEWLPKDIEDLESLIELGRLEFQS